MYTLFTSRPCARCVAGWPQDCFTFSTSVF